MSGKNVVIVSADGRSLETVELTVCGRTVRLHDLRITPARTFAYSGSAADGNIRVTLEGRFLDSRRVRFARTLRGKGCSAKRLTVVASLS